MVYLQHVMDRVWVLRIFVKNFTVSGEQALDVQKSQMEKCLTLFEVHFIYDALKLAFQTERLMENVYSTGCFKKNGDIVRF